ncbi:galactoside alpha-(1,2)-fucosyltransferase 1-like [Watersipora subatra]|uniref:galactoside alpha-(1,2)-fucosyltransferase 1-like n=1 Tax=Watersipora subatra TaxID=2589382 RepID=UPI00355B70E8
MAPTSPIERKHFCLTIAIAVFLFTMLVYRSASPVAYNVFNSQCDCRSSEEPECITVCKKITSVFLPKLYDHGLNQTATPASAAVTTTTPPHPVIPNLGECDACLAGKSLVTVNKGWLCGQARIGNKMFMMAPAIAAAAKLNRTFVLPQDGGSCDWIDMLKEFFISVSSTVPLLPEKSFKDWEVFGEGGFTHFSPIEPDSNQNISIGGYRQSWKYFNSSSQASALRETFRFNKKYDSAAVHSLESAKSALKIQQPIFVGVHMRIGDLKDKDRLNYGYQMANQSFYLNALEAAKTCLNQSESIIFIVASDTLKDAKEMLSPAEKLYNIVWLHGSAYEDFATLSYCNHSIISGGTYGFWTAWLAGGETFYFSNFSKPGTNFHKGFIASNFYLPQWRPVGWSKYVFQ